MTFLVLLLAYLVGLVPFGLILGFALKGVDLRQTGSGNIGAANAFRTLGVAGGLLVLMLDLSKGLGPVLLVAHLGLQLPGGLPLWQVLAGMTAIIGHNNSVFLGFKGGKGIATSLGVVIGLSWKAALICLVVYAIAMAVTRYASVSSLCGVSAAPFVLYYLSSPDDSSGLPARTVYVAFSLIAVVFAFYKHRTNIKNLLAGTEPKLMAGKAGRQPVEGLKP